MVVSLSTNNLTVIRSATVFAEGIFEGETFVVHPRIDQVTHHLDIPLVPPKDTPLDIHIRVCKSNNSNYLFSNLIYYYIIDSLNIGSIFIYIFLGVCGF